MRSGQKTAKIGRPNFFFDPPKNEKPSVQKAPLYKIYGDFPHLKLIYTHQAHQNPQKPILVEVKMSFFFESFDVFGGGKSILNVKPFHKTHIAELFGPRVFRFSVGQKKSFLSQFWRFLFRP